MRFDQVCTDLVQNILKIMGFPGGSAVKNPPADAGDVGSIPESGRSPREGNDNPLQYSGKSHGWRNLVGYNPQGRRELDTTKQLHFLSFFPT